MIRGGFEIEIAIVIDISCVEKGWLLSPFTNTNTSFYKDSSRSILLHTKICIYK